MTSYFQPSTVRAPGERGKEGKRGRVSVVLHDAMTKPTSMITIHATFATGATYYASIITVPLTTPQCLQCHSLRHNTYSATSYARILSVPFTTSQGLPCYIFYYALIVTPFFSDFISNCLKLRVHLQLNLE